MKELPDAEDESVALVDTKVLEEEEKLREERKKAEMEKAETVRERATPDRGVPRSFSTARACLAARHVKRARCPVSGRNGDAHDPSRAFARANRRDRPSRTRPTRDRARPRRSDAAPRPRAAPPPDLPRRAKIPPARGNETAGSPFEFFPRSSKKRDAEALFFAFPRARA